jgi:molybdopterin synthase sulfur carrier subunit
MQVNMQVTVKLFAIFQETFGVEEMQIELEPNARISQVFDRLATMQPQLEQWRSLTRYALNLEFVEPDTPLPDCHTEVALIPPVSGG